MNGLLKIQASAPNYSFISDILTGVLKSTVIPSNSVPGASTKFVIGALTNALILLFVFVIIAAIIFAILAGFKYIQSQGDAEKVKEAQEALKSVLIGVATVFLGVIGVVIISGIFTSSNTDTVRRAFCTFLEPGDIDLCVIGSKT